MSRGPDPREGHPATNSLRKKRASSRFEAPPSASTCGKSLTEAKRIDVKLADSFGLNPDSIVPIDRGYIDYALFCRWSMADVFFVTRLKDERRL
jgi:hypothetical protein